MSSLKDIEKAIIDCHAAIGGGKSQEGSAETCLALQKVHVLVLEVVHDLERKLSDERKLAQYEEEK